MFRRNRDKPESPNHPLDHAGEELRNESLVDAMRAVSVADNPASRALLFQLLLESTLVVLSPTAPAEVQTRTSQAGDTLQLVTYTDEEGTVLPVFTSIAAVQRFRPEGTGYVALPGSALFQMAGSAGTNKILFDPGSSTGGFITRSEIEALSRGRLPIGGGSEVVAATTSVRIGRPAVPPSPRVLDAVRSTLHESTIATRAWLTMMQQGEDQPELVIAIRFRGAAGPPQMRAIVEGIGARAGAEASELRFLEADDALQQSLESGAGELIYAASQP